VKGIVDVTEPSKSGNSSLVTRKKIPFQGPFSCPGYDEEYEEGVT